MDGLLIMKKREFVYFDLLSLFEKMQEKPSKHVISYADIDYIRIDYSLVDPVKGMGSTTLILEVHKNNGEIESVPIFTFLRLKERIIMSLSKS